MLFLRFLDIVGGEGNEVIQCPAIFQHLLDFPENVFIIIMKRDVDEIVKSQNRIGWTKREEPREKQKFQKYSDVLDLSMTISEIKYQFLLNISEKLKENIVMLDYSSLSEHELCVKPALRFNFNSHQWKTR